MTHKFVWLALTGVLAATSLSGCGFQLRGYHNTERLKMVRSLPATQLVFGNAPEDVAVKNALKHQFALMTLPTVDGPTLTNNSAVLVDTKGQPTIQVRNIQLQTYRLRGLLTEIRMVMSAEVTYQFQQNGAPKIVKNTIQVQRSYQYDQANVATDNPQAEQIKVWLYDNIAQRVAEQYLALAVPTTLPAKLPTP
jgi:LPS-assembly lipoprotein